MEEDLKKITEGLSLSKETKAGLQKEIKNVLDYQKKIKSLEGKSVSELIGAVLGGGILLNASDVHIEPEEKKTKLRLRIDGLLEDVAFVEESTYQSLLSRIKLLSGLKLNISDRPQDGRFSVVEPEITIEIRVSTLPSEYGESIVLRILNPKSLISLDSLGLRADLLSLFKKEVKKPNGMVIVTGPTGSGKTTTLYAFLKTIQKPEIKIITIEDPIEYHLEGISQTQVNPNKGYDFATGLQSIVRQDPDVILVGEIRDSKTCQISLQAALTGHLVLTTLHTNDAAGTVVRLISLKGELVNIGPAINLAIAQRLVRRVCKKCSKLEKASPASLNKIKAALRGMPKGVKFPKVKEGLKLLRAKGCKECNLTGFKGRIGLFEAILIDDEMEKFILNNPSIAAFKKEAIKRGTVTIYQDGVIKVLEGITTLEEVERVTGE